MLKPLLRRLIIYEEKLIYNNYIRGIILLRGIILCERLLNSSYHYHIIGKKFKVGKN